MALSLFLKSLLFSLFNVFCHQFIALKVNMFSFWTKNVLLMFIRTSVDLQNYNCTPSTQVRGVGMEAGAVVFWTRRAVGQVVHATFTMHFRPIVVLHADMVQAPLLARQPDILLIRRVVAAGVGVCVLTIMYSPLFFCRFFLLYFFTFFRFFAALLPLMCHAPRQARKVELTIESRRRGDGRGGRASQSSEWALQAFLHIPLSYPAPRKKQWQWHQQQLQQCNMTTSVAFACWRHKGKRQKVARQQTLLHTHTHRQWKTVTESHCKGKMFFPAWENNNNNREHQPIRPEIVGTHEKCILDFGTYGASHT